MAFAAFELPSDNGVRSNSPFRPMQTTQQDEWLGEKYLDYALAHILLRNRSGSIGITSLNASLLQELAGFGYEKFCEQLGLRNNVVQPYQAIHLSSSQNHTNFREAAVGWIGAVVRRGTAEERGVLDRAIIDNVALPDLELRHQSNAITPPQMVLADQEEPRDLESTSIDSETEIWQYTKTLQEQFAGQDAAPIYEEFMVRGYPPKFKAVVAFRGKTFSGEAGNKKLAKHRASKRLCGDLGISIPGL